MNNITTTITPNNPNAMGTAMVVSTVVSNDKLLKPIRKNYYFDVVIDIKGGVVPKETWMKVVNPTLTGKALAGSLRKHNMQLVHLFNRELYIADKTLYQETTKLAKKTSVETTIMDAFAKANIIPEAHIVKALKDLIPLFKTVSPNKMSSAFKGVVRTVAHGLANANNQGNQSMG